ncbi:hypothetical protein RRG08_059206 [Elysia crispata]|uniref:Uncharacterized protein n=1 Tax=Elysia crispata TaxID=231223 RepID=A0AAE0ZEE0_9GAST|nr:hypothetical protein RRG08_059206 [Elysia crispata]
MKLFLAPWYHKTLAERWPRTRLYIRPLPVSPVEKDQMIPREPSLIRVKPLVVRGYGGLQGSYSSPAPHLHARLQMEADGLVGGVDQSVSLRSSHSAFLARQTLAARWPRTRLYLRPLPVSPVEKDQMVGSSEWYRAKPKRCSRWDVQHCPAIPRMEADGLVGGVDQSVSLRSSHSAFLARQPMQPNFYRVFSMEFDGSCILSDLGPQRFWGGRGGQHYGEVTQPGRMALTSVAKLEIKKTCGVSFVLVAAAGSKLARLITTSLISR